MSVLFHVAKSLNVIQQVPEIDRNHRKTDLLKLFHLSRLGEESLIPSTCDMQRIFESDSV